MKKYNCPETQVVDCKASYMLMGNVSGDNIQGINEGPVQDPIDIY